MDVPDFDAVYQADADPWRVRSSFYERRKLEIVLACLDQPSYATAWDPACGVGELAARLSSRADRVLASDASGQAVGLTRTRVADLPGVTVAHQALPAPPPADWLNARPVEPAAGVALVILSEFVYYLSPAARQDSLTMISSVAAERAELVSLHWRHKPHDAYLSGAEVQVEIAERLGSDGWTEVVRHRDRDFVLQSFTRGDR